MTSNTTNTTELLEQYSRRGLWVALALLLLLGGYAITINVFPDSAAAAMADKAFSMLPIVIVIAVAAMRTSLKGVSADPRSAAMKAVLNDELRQVSLQRAYRNGFVAVLLAQPVMVMLVHWFALPHPVELMASCSAVVGVATLLVSVLYFDR